MSNWIKSFQNNPALIITQLEFRVIHTECNEAVHIKISDSDLQHSDMCNKISVKRHYVIRLKSTRMEDGEKPIHQ